MRTLGSVCYWHTLKGFGFIEIITPVAGDPSGLAERDTLYFHNTDVARRQQPHVGDGVSFEIAPSGNTKHPWRARNVQIERAVEAVRP